MKRARRYVVQNPGPTRPPPKPCAPDWTPEQETALRRMYEAGERLAVIAEELNRTQGACRERAKKAGCRRPRNRRQRKQQAEGMDHLDRVDYGDILDTLLPRHHYPVHSCGGWRQVPTNPNDRL